MRRLTLLAAAVTLMPFAAQPAQHEHAAAKSKTTLTGCLVEVSQQRYVVRDDSGKEIEIAGKASKLSEHVNHKIRLGGEYEVNDVDLGGNQGNAAQAGGMASGGRFFKIDRIEHVSDGCGQ